MLTVAAATQTASPVPGAAGARGAVNQLPKSPVREICTPGTVGTGGGRPPPVTRWAVSNHRPYREPEHVQQNACTERPVHRRATGGRHWSRGKPPTGCYGRKTHSHRPELRRVA